MSYQQGQQPYPYQPQGQPPQQYYPGQPPYAGPPQYARPPYPLQQQYAGPYRAVTKQRKDTSHGFHLAMTLLTFGMWGLFVWLPITIWHALGPKRKVVTRYR